MGTHLSNCKEPECLTVDARAWSPGSDPWAPDKWDLYVTSIKASICQGGGDHTKKRSQPIEMLME